MCTPFDDCFLYKHVFYINHCWLLQSVGNELQVKASIINMAEIITPVEIPVSSGYFVNITWVWCIINVIIIIIVVTKIVVVVIVVVVVVAVTPAQW